MQSQQLSSPINKVLDLRKCVDCLRNYTRMYGCYLMQCALYRELVKRGIKNNGIAE